MQGMNAFNATLGPIDMQAPLLEINLRLAKLTQLGSAKAMSIREQDRCSIPWAVAPSLSRSFDQPINFCLSQILPRPVRCVG
jgi:hypothetical protein